ncbi:hypothetical protein CEUSTIGMA_g12748.t1 [Chlamydomonas eustigma]|uniref:Uncharacterized protein n=1 Tax=Chlamydomonas eustigma TaxID=1157962 RepID=A0A250XQH9_9CHLO|nr:hypothetical protein CEUSTIGMA_g12748.t1 [Chlamydomonas eustigma]|eukprot:GAX85331.1 hypothetical protein CEUSTIGMA_g12748.t1 [Chlamydomonas eustigma]
MMQWPTKERGAEAERQQRDLAEMRATSWASLEESTKGHSWLLTLLSKLCGRWVASMMMSFFVGDVIDKQPCGGMSDGPLLSLTCVNNPLAAGHLTQLAECPYEKPLLLIEEEEGLVTGGQALLLVNRSDHDSASSQTPACGWGTFLQSITTKNNLTSSSSVSPLHATCHFALASQPGDSQQYNETSLWGSRPDSPADCMTPIIHRTGSHGSIDEKGQVTEMMPVAAAPAASVASGQRLHRGSLQDDYDDATAPISLLYGSSRGARSISNPGGVMSFTSFDLTTSPVSVVIPGATTGGNFNETTRALMITISPQEEQHQQCDEYLPLLMSLRSALAASEARNEKQRLCAEETGIRYRKDRMELENELMELKKVALQVICENEALKEGRGLLLQQVQNERTKAVMSPIHALPREQLSDLMWKTGKKLGKGGCAEVFELVDEVEDAASSMSFAFKKALPGCGFMIESEVVALQSARGPGVMAVESVVMCNEVLEGRSGRPEDMTPVGYTMEQMDGCLESLLSPIPSSTPEHNTWSKAVVRGGRNSLGGRDAGAKLSATGVRSRQDSSTRSAGHLCDEDGVRIEDIDGKSVIKEDALKQLKHQLWVEEGGYCIIPTSTTSAATFPELLERLLCDHSLHQVKHEEGLHAVVDLFMCSNSIFQDFDRNKNPLTDGDQRQMIVIDEAEAVVSHYVDSQTVESCIVHPQDLHVGLSNDVMTSNQILSDIQKYGSASQRAFSRIFAAHHRLGKLDADNGLTVSKIACITLKALVAWDKQAVHDQITPKWAMDGTQVVKASYIYDVQPVKEHLLRHSKTVPETRTPSTGSTP